MSEWDEGPYGAALGRLRAARQTGQDTDISRRDAPEPDPGGAAPDLADVRADLAEAPRADLADDLRARLADRRAVTASARQAAAAYAALQGHVPGGAESELEHAGARRWALRPRTAIVAVCAVLLLGVGAAVVSWPRSGVETLGTAGGQTTAEPDAPGDAAYPAPSTAFPSPDAASPGDAPAASVVVDVVGQVREPCVVTLPAGSRVADAVAAAGGASDNADLAAVNLARPLVDGEQVRVPAPGEMLAPPTSGPPSDGGGLAPSDGGLVNLNTADEATLDTLPGIGPALAARIIAWREQNGAFASVDELDEVSGIGPALLAGLRDQVTV
ncbi:ComEA family DNA-binding protein [Xylanimonas ulmi]|uniref:Competence protein ComEA n=1 Tax=Xylanimonas ulmi TaxID=228973 RepID=A0A4V2EXP9_9MICO|nr:ComEA family DNA-binding protein [Xylanibacterium ulmi]RZS60250.1 competence protein ComEA [Xylanibacterium ulmi]